MSCPRLNQMPSQNVRRVAWMVLVRDYSRLAQGMMKMEIRIFLKTSKMAHGNCMHRTHIRKIDKWNVYQVLLAYQGAQLHQQFLQFSSEFPREFSCLLVRNRLELVAEQRTENGSFHDDAALGEDELLNPVSRISEEEVFQSVGHARG